MQNLKGMLRKFVVEESGQSSTEYILILFLAFMVFSKIKKSLLPILNTLIGETESKGQDAMSGWQ